MKKKIRFFFVVIIITLSVVALANAQSQTIRPNFVIILTDDQRYDSSTPEYMPLLNELIADKGIKFDQAYAAAALCCPSRSSILTGKFVHNHRVLGNSDGANKFKQAGNEENNLAVWLFAAGYRTGLFGKYLNRYDKMTPWPYVPPGWSEWNAFKGYRGYRLHPLITSIHKN